MTLLYLFRNQGTIKGKSFDEFDPEMSAKKFHNAFKGLGTDEKVVIDLLTMHNNVQRQEIRRKYVDIYGKDLTTDLQDELGGHFLDTCVTLMCPTAMYEAQNLRKAMSWGTKVDSSCLIDILSTRTNNELASIKEAYFAENGSMLQQDLAMLNGAQMAHILSSLSAGVRDESKNVDAAMAEADAAEMILSSNGKLELNSHAFSTILCLRNRQQLELTFEMFKKKTSGIDLETEIRKEFTGDEQQGLIAFIKLMHNPVAYFAEKINECLKGSLTDDETLIRILVSRSEIDLDAIKLEYQQKYKTSLAKAIRNDCSGDYCRLLLKILAET